MSDNPTVANSATSAGSPDPIAVRGDADASGNIRQVMRLDVATGTDELLVSGDNPLPAELRTSGDVVSFDNRLPVVASIQTSFGSSIAYGAGVSDAATIRTVIATDSDTCSTASLTNVASSATSVTLIGSNTSRRSLIIYNDSTAVLYVKYGTTASSGSYTLQIGAGGYWEMPKPAYTGRIDGIWASANGNARVTELS